MFNNDSNYDDENLTNNKFYFLINKREKKYDAYSHNIDELIESSRHAILQNAVKLVIVVTEVIY